MITLIVDDSDITLKVMESILTSHGHACIAVQHGLEALVCLESVPEIHLVISDVDMPGMNGLELLEEMKKRKEWLDVGIIMCSNRADVETIQHVKALGCNAFLLKPVPENQLMNKIEAVLDGIPKVLQDALITCNKFKLTLDSYTEISKTFHQELEQTIKMIDTDDTDCSEKQRYAAIVKIQDGAELVGAPRLANLYKPTKTQTAAAQEIYINEHATQFLREFKVLSSELNTKLN